MRGRIVTAVCFLLGLSLCSYPLISSIAERKFQEETVATYQREIRKKEDWGDVLKQAHAYNSMLLQTEGALVGNVNTEILSDRNYRKQLDIGKDGMMGSLEIPVINVNLPVWHGTSEKVISNGVGHFQGSSLPVGGENTRSVLTSHRGLPSSKLFTRLDELKKGDLFFLNICGDILAYQIYKIEVVEPDDTEKLHIIRGKDIVSLVTCTPYGLNTHRLVVNGERVSYEQKVYDGIRQEMFSVREFIFGTLPFVFSGVMAAMQIRNRKRCKREEEERKINLQNRRSTYGSSADAGRQRVRGGS